MDNEGASDNGEISIQVNKRILGVVDTISIVLREELVVDLELTGVWLGLWVVVATSVEAVVTKITEFVNVEPTGSAVSIEAFKLSVDFGEVITNELGEASPSGKFGAVCWDEQDLGE